MAGVGYAGNPDYAAVLMDYQVLAWHEYYAGGLDRRFHFTGDWD